MKLRIGDVTLSIEGDTLEGDWEVPPAYRAFISDGATEISLRLQHGAFDILLAEKLFDCAPVWRLYRQNGTFLIKIFDKLPSTERTLVLSSDIEKTDLYFAEESGPFTDPFYGPTIELLMLNYLAQGRGVIIHSCSIARNGKGIIFAGESGDGKSTLARMWDQENGVDVLSDDRIIVRKNGHQFWMYGTPWHGDAQFVSPQGVRLEGFFFIRHGEKNTIKEIKGVDAISQLLTCSFPSHWDPCGMEFSLDLLTDLTAHLPCREFTFKPEKSALDLVEEMRG